MTLASQWESKKVMTSPLAAPAPSRRVLISPSLFLVLRIRTFGIRVMYSSSATFRCSAQNGKRNRKMIHHNLQAAIKKYAWSQSIKQVPYLKTNYISLLLQFLTFGMKPGEFIRYNQYVSKELEMDFKVAGVTSCSIKVAALQYPVKGWKPVQGFCLLPTACWQLG